jgi:hypothetical protein
MAIKKVLFTALVVLALSLVGAAQLRADAVVDFNYSFGGNTFSWELPVNPVVTPDNVYPGIAFTLPDVSFTENGVAMTGTMDFFSSTSGGGFDLWSGYYFYFCNAFGPQLYTGPESSPTLLTGNFSLADAENTDYFLAGTGTLDATSVPEPSALSLLMIGMAFGLAIFALRKQ